MADNGQGDHSNKHDDSHSQLGLNPGGAWNASHLPTQQYQQSPAAGPILPPQPLHHPPAGSGPSGWAGIGNKTFSEIVDPGEKKPWPAQVGGIPYDGSGVGDGHLLSGGGGRIGSNDLGMHHTVISSTGSTVSSSITTISGEQLQVGGTLSTTAASNSAAGMGISTSAQSSVSNLQQHTSAISSSALQDPSLSTSSVVAGNGVGSWSQGSGPPPPTSSSAWSSAPGGLVGTPTRPQQVTPGPPAASPSGGAGILATPPGWNSGGPSNPSRDSVSSENSQQHGGGAGSVDGERSQLSHAQPDMPPSGTGPTDREWGGDNAQQLGAGAGCEDGGNAQGSLQQQQQLLRQQQWEGQGTGVSGMESSQVNQLPSAIIPQQEGSVSGGGSSDGANGSGANGVISPQWAVPGGDGSGDGPFGRAGSVKGSGPAKPPAPLTDEQLKVQALVNDPECWGKTPVNQETQWAGVTFDKPPDDSNTWNAMPNTGTAVWEQSRGKPLPGGAAAGRNGGPGMQWGAPADRKGPGIVQGSSSQQAWGAAGNQRGPTGNQPGNNGPGHHEEDPNVWNGAASVGKDNALWDKRTEARKEDPSGQWNHGGPAPPTQWGGSSGSGPMQPQQQPPPHNQGPPPPHSNMSGGWAGGQQGRRMGAGNMQMDEWGGGSMPDHHHHHGGPPPGPPPPGAQQQGWRSGGGDAPKGMGWGETGKKPMGGGSNGDVDTGTAYWGEPTNHNKPSSNWNSGGGGPPSSGGYPPNMGGGGPPPQGPAPGFPRGSGPPNTGASQSGWPGGDPPPDHTGRWGGGDANQQGKNRTWNDEMSAGGGQGGPGGTQWTGMRRTVSQFDEGPSYAERPPSTAPNRRMSENDASQGHNDTDMGEWTDNQRQPTWSLDPRHRVNAAKNNANAVQGVGIGNTMSMPPGAGYQHAMKVPNNVMGVKKPYGGPNQTRQQALDTLVGMGFPRDDAQGALIHNNLNVGAAINDLRKNGRGPGGMPHHHPGAMSEMGGGPPNMGGPPPGGINAQYGPPSGPSSFQGHSSRPGNKLPNQMPHGGGMMHPMLVKQQMQQHGGPMQGGMGPGGKHQQPPPSQQGGGPGPHHMGVTSGPPGSMGQQQPNMMPHMFSGGGGGSGGHIVPNSLKDSHQGPPPQHQPQMWNNPNNTVGQMTDQFSSVDTNAGGGMNMNQQQQQLQQQQQQQQGGAQSRLVRWRDPNVGGGGPIVGAPGTNSTALHPSASMPNMLQDDKSWSSGDAKWSGGPPQSGGHKPGGAGGNEFPAIPEFVPGKPWPGMHSGKPDDNGDNPSNTPNGFPYGASSGRQDDGGVWANSSSKGPGMPKTVGWPGDGANQLGHPGMAPGLWSGGGGERSGGGPSRPPPGLVGGGGVEHKPWSPDGSSLPTAHTSQLRRSGSWAPGEEKSAFSPVSSGWDPTWLILRSGEVPVQETTMKALCSQHGTVVSFNYSQSPNGQSQAYVQFSTPEAAATAKKFLSGCELGISAEPANTEYGGLMNPSKQGSAGGGGAQWAGHGGDQPPASTWARSSGGGGGGGTPSNVWGIDSTSMLPSGLDLDFSM